MNKDIAYYMRRARVCGLDTGRINRMLSNIRQHELPYSEEMRVEYLEGLDYMKRPICGK